MATTPIFNQVAPQAYELSTVKDAPVEDYWGGYFTTPDAGLGSTLSTQDVWDNVGGFYLFLGAVVLDWSIFTEKMNALRSKLAPANQLRAYWVENPNDPSQQWRTSMVLALPSSSGGTTTWMTKNASTFVLGEYGFVVNGMSPMEMIPDNDGGGVRFTTGGNFAGPTGGYFLPSVDLQFSNPGVFYGNVPIPAATSETPTVWEALRMGLQYAQAPNSTLTQKAEDKIKETVLSGEQTDPMLNYKSATKILFMPVFGSQDDALEFELLLDPLRPMNSQRSAVLVYNEQNAQSSFRSYFRTTRGYPTELIPMQGQGAIGDARFVFGRCPVVGDDGSSGYRYHLSPDGAFQLNVTIPQGAELAALNTSETFELLLGLSGIEYVTLLGKDNTMLYFKGGQPAFIPVSDEEGKALPVAMALTDKATTSFLTVMAIDTANGNPGYFAQPKEAPLYSGRNERTDNVLDFNPMLAFTLSSDTTNLPDVFPAGPYAGMVSTDSDLAREFENSSLAPYRHYVITEAYGVGDDPVGARKKRRARTAEDQLGVTPQGLVAELTADYNDFDGLFLGNMPGTRYPDVLLTEVQGKFKETLQSNQLFFVAANVDVLMEGTSVSYQLDAGDVPYLQAKGVPDDVINNTLAATRGQVYETEDDFKAAISPTAGEYEPEFLEVCGILKVEMDGWTFQLSPRSWRKDDTSPTLMIAKFCNRSLYDMINDSSSWGWPEVAVRDGKTLEDTVNVLQGIISAATAKSAGSAYLNFITNVVMDPNWNGFLFLNAPIDIGELPDDLKFLAAGVDLEQFYAHHIGFSQTPFKVQGGQPVLEQTAAFGLIDYIDTLDLYSDETIQFGFKTMQLKARFANAALVDFSAQVELMINRIFAAPLQKQEAARGNNLIINGTYQRIGGKPSYSFVLADENIFDASLTAMTTFEVLSVQLITGGQTTDVDEVITTFLLNGNMQFIEIPEFDQFSFGVGESTPEGYLRYNGVAIKMTFQLAEENSQVFELSTTGTSFDLPNSSDPRANSLFNNFPLSITALISSPNLVEGEAKEPEGLTPEQMGFTSVSAPLEQTPMKPGWYGLQYTLDLGTLGALTGSQGIKMNILCAWSRGESDVDPPVYVGIKLPNMPAIGGSFPLQGVLKLGFRSFLFETYSSEGGKLGYRLILRQFALSVLVWSFPPGNNEIILFGQPGNPQGSLGWYAAYSDGKTSTKPTGGGSSAKRLTVPEEKETSAMEERIQRRLATGRRTPPAK